MILNSAKPQSEEAHILAAELEEKYGVPVALVCCPELNDEDIKEILALVLGEFPVRSMKFTVPSWFEALPEGHRLEGEVIEGIKSFASKITKLGDIEKSLSDALPYERVAIDAGDGTAEFKVPLDMAEYFAFASEAAGKEIRDEGDMLKLLCEYAATNEKWQRVEAALADAEEKGYGIVMPKREELKLEEPKLERSSGGWGAKVTAYASSIHMIKTDRRTDICPVIGSEEQAAEVVKYLGDEYEQNPEDVWEYNMFGRSLYDMVHDGMTSKLTHLPSEARARLSDTIGKIINEGSNGLICILL